MAAHDFLWYDVFTDRRFAGNPLAVFPDASGIGDDEMARIARELNLSETTFVLPPEDPGTTHRVRIFTPGRELSFAGHPTIGTAVALADLAGGGDADLVLGLGAGPTPVTVRRTGDGVRARFVAPQVPVLRAASFDLDTAAAAIGVVAEDLDDSVPLHLADAGGSVFLVVLARSLEALARCRPVGGDPDIVGVYVASPHEGGFQARMFAPAVGVPEDPATGGASVAFAASLVAHVEGFGVDGTHRVELRQGVEMGRPSEISLEFDVVASALTEVRLAGSAVRVLTGSLAPG